MRVDTQRGYVDLLRAISSCNRDKNRTLGFIVSEYKFVEVVTMFPSEAVKEAGCLRRFLKLTLRQLPAAIDRLLTAIQPFLGTHSNSHPQHCMGPTAKQFLEKSYKLLLLAKYNQLASPNPEHRAHPHFTHDQQAHLQLDQLKTEAAGKLKDCLKVMAVEAGCLKPAYSPNYLEYA